MENERAVIEIGVFPESVFKPGLPVTIIVHIQFHCTYLHHDLGEITLYKLCEVKVFILFLATYLEIGIIPYLVNECPL